MKNHKTFVLIVSVLFIILSACSPSPVELTKRFTTTYNTHDVNKIVALYTNNAVFEVVGKLSFKGKNQIYRVTQYDSVLNIHMTISNILMRADTAFYNLTETNDWYKTAGIDATHYKMKLIFKKDLITHLQAEVKPETQKAVSQVLSPFVKWAAENNTDILKEMMPEGKFIYNAENAKKSLSLLLKWKESLKK